MELRVLQIHESFALAVFGDFFLHSVASGNTVQAVQPAASRLSPGPQASNMHIVQFTALFSLLHFSSQLDLLHFHSQVSSNQFSSVYIVPFTTELPQSALHGCGVIYYIIKIE